METIERVIPRESLYETLKKVCDDKYSIGFHAINYFRFPEEEITELNNLVSMYLDYAERQVKLRHIISMKE